MEASLLGSNLIPVTSNQTGDVRNTPRAIEVEVEPFGIVDGFLLFDRPARNLPVADAANSRLKTSLFPGWSLASIAADVSGHGVAVSDDTTGEYIAALRRLMVVEGSPVWNTHLRSRHRLRTSPTRHFVDPSLAVAALGATRAQLRVDLRALGLLFESLVVRDLRVYAQPLRGRGLPVPG